MTCHLLQQPANKWLNLLFIGKVENHLKDPGRRVHQSHVLLSILAMNIRMTKLDMGIYIRLIDILALMYV